nr:reverse transcriptase domain-containing protein [Tanacetum cinerariifolium]
MSSPNHPTSDIEEAFSSTNTPDYTPASPHYFPASPGNTSPDPSKYLTKDLLASPVFSPFHDNPYMKDFYSRTNHQGYPGSPLIRYEEYFWIQSMSPRTAKEDHHQATRLDPMAPKRTSTSAAPTMTQAAIWQLVTNNVATALETQAANMENTDNTNRKPEPRETLAARKCTYKEFMSCQPFYFNGMEGAVSLIRWFKRTKSEFSHSNYTEDCKVKFATGTLTEDALFWWNSYVKPKIA